MAGNVSCGKADDLKPRESSARIFKQVAGLSRTHKFTPLSINARLDGDGLFWATEE